MSHLDYPPPILGSEYTCDILIWLREREKEAGLTVRLQSPQLDRRLQLVEWSGDVAASLGLTTNTLHLAIKLIDLFMDGHDIQVTILEIATAGSCRSS